jgi:hypothetical protein
VKRNPHSKKAHGCPSGKKRFRDKRECVSWLHHAANARVRAEADGVPTNHRAVRSYQCPDCRGFHVTSWVLAA